MFQIQGAWKKKLLTTSAVASNSIKEEWASLKCVLTCGNAASPNFVTNFHMKRGLLLTN